MRGLRLLSLCIVAFLALPEEVHCDLYQWQDENGGWHVSSSPDKIPERYRNRVKQIESPEREEAPPAPVLKPKRQDRTGSTAPTTGGQNPSAQLGPKTYRVPCRRAGGSLVVSVALNDAVTIPMVLDTGASYVTLSRGLAEQLGISLKDVLPRTWVGTANGIITAYFVRLSSVMLGDARVENVTAIIPEKSNLGVPGLLGLSFLGEFDWSHDTRNGRLTLREFQSAPNEETYGGHGKAWWQGKFEALKDRTREEKKILQSMTDYDTRGPQEQDALDRLVRIQQANVDFFRKELDLLDTKASRLMVPRHWR